MFTIVIYRGQETFQVPIIGYINSVAYVQREIDNILRKARAWARTYMDDIIYGAKSLPDLLEKLVKAGWLVNYKWPTRGGEAQHA